MECIYYTQQAEIKLWNSQWWKWTKETATKQN